MILAVANQKGGVGKTTTAVTLGAALSRLGKRVLVVDLDPNANASMHLSHYSEATAGTAYELFVGVNGDGPPWRRLIRRDERSGLDFIPGHIRLSELDVDFKNQPGKGLALKRGLASLDVGYDFVVMDCPPHVGILLVNALVACDRVVVPVQTDFMALHGVKLLFDTMRTLNKLLGRTIDYKALPTMYDRRIGACRRVLKILRSNLPGRVFETCIGVDARLREASAQGTTVFALDEKSRGAREYMLLAREVAAA